MGDRGKLLVKLALEKLQARQQKQPTSTEQFSQAVIITPAISVGIVPTTPEILPENKVLLSPQSVLPIENLAQYVTSANDLPTNDLQSFNLNDAEFIYENEISLGTDISLAQSQAADLPRMKPLYVFAISNEMDHVPNTNNENLNNISNACEDMQPDSTSENSDYHSEESDASNKSISSLMESTEHDNEDSFNTNSKQKNKKRLAQQVNRMLGKKYLGFRKVPTDDKIVQIQDVQKEGRQIGPKCTVHTCRKFANFMDHCGAVSEIDRVKMFRHFWKLSWQEKKIYICSLVQERETERATTTNEPSSRRSFSLKYKININGLYIQVCKKMFLSTFGIKQSLVAKCVRESQYGIITQPKKTISTRTNTENHQFMCEFLDSLNKLPSHYCRKETNKLYLEQKFETKSSLYTEYSNHCISSGKNRMSKTKFLAEFANKNLALFTPLKDRCDTCVQHETGNLSDEAYQIHIAQKNRAQQEKEKDNDHAMNGLCHLIYMDLQAVKICPMLNSSSTYFKTKLACHNFTIYNKVTREVVCNWFDETTADLQASVFASLLIKYLKDNFFKDNDGLPKIIYSDGCTYQNRNAMVSNAILTLAIEYNTTIIQKYLVKGHTHMECDSVHAKIEQKLKKKKIEIPNDYHHVTVEARQKPFPYKVFAPDFSFFQDFSVYKMYPSIRPGRHNVVTNLRQLQYSPQGLIAYKIYFDDELVELPTRPKKQVIKKTADFPQLFLTRKNISKRKFMDLQSMKVHIHQNFWAFYDNLPHNQD